MSFVRYGSSIHGCPPMKLTGNMLDGRHQVSLGTDCTTYLYVTEAEMREWAASLHTFADEVLAQWPQISTDVPTEGVIS